MQVCDKHLMTEVLDMKGPRDSVARRVFRGLKASVYGNADQIDDSDFTEDRRSDHQKTAGYYYMYTNSSVRFQVVSRMRL